MLTNYLSDQYKDLNNFILKEKDNYQNAKPFPHTTINNFFDSKYLDKVLNDFPKNLNSLSKNLSDDKELMEWDDINSKKITTKKPSPAMFKEKIHNFLNELNSFYFIDFLQKITGIKERIIPDPYFWGGGMHISKRGGYAKIHADYNIHPKMKLDRRINVLIYLNKDWKEEYGGYLELWNREMTECLQKVSPSFNTVVIFNTNDYTYHGHPDPLLCPENVTRNSIALYYYTNGRPASEIDIHNFDHSTLFKNRKNVKEINVVRVEYKKVFGKYYVKKKFKSVPSS